MKLDDLTSQTIFLQSPISTQIFSPTGESLMANKAWEKLWGVKHKQIEGYNILKDKQLEAKGIMLFIKKGFAGETVHIPAVMYEPQKTIPVKSAVKFRWVKALIYPVKDKTGNIVQVVLQHEDITDQKNAEQALLASEIRFKTLTSFAPVGIFQTDTEGNCLYVNNRWCEYAGLTPDQAKGKGWINALHPDDKKRIFKEWYEAATKKKEFISEYRFKNKDGKITWLSGNAVAIKDEKGNVTGYLGTITDISDKKLNAEKLKESEERLRLAINAGNIGVWDWDITNNHITWSDKLFEIHGISKKRFKGTVDEFMQLIYPDDKKMVATRLQQSLRDNAPYQLEFRAFGPQKKVIWIATSAQVIHDQKHNPLRMLGATIDVTERKQLEKQKDEFIGLASHELKTPVTSIKVYTQVLQNSFAKKGDEKSAQLLKKMDGQIDKLTLLISDLLDVTRIEEGRLAFRKESFDMNDLISEVTEQVQRTAVKHTILLNLIESKNVYGDRDRYGQVLTNLLTNAMKYSPSDTNITVSTQVTNSELLVSVIDSGIGISKDKQKHIFERFFRIAHEKDTYPGLGLGLYISKEIVERQGGRIYVESKLQHGSTFTFSVPLNV